MNRIHLIPAVLIVPAACAVMFGYGMGAREDHTAPSAQSTADPSVNAATSGVRIGIYDNRAIAIAYAGSKYNDVTAKMKEYQQAKAASDQAKMKSLDAWGRQRQRELNHQGFARMPVTDLLEPVKDQLPALAKNLGVSAIVFECNFVDPRAGVEEVDVTMDLVKLYEPTEMSLKWIAETIKKPPVGLDDLTNEKP